MSKKFLIVISILSAGAVFIFALPYIGVYLFSFLVSTSDYKEEKQTKKEVEDYLEQKYQREFQVEVEVNSLGIGTEVNAYPKGEPSYSFSVETLNDPIYKDSLLDTIYKKKIESALQDYPNLKNKESLHIKMFFDNKTFQDKTFDFQESFPELSNIPVIPTFIVTDSQVSDEINRKAVLDSLQQVIQFIQKENIQLKEINATITVEAPDLYYYYHYLIPKEEFTNLTTVESLKSFEDVKVVKPQ